VSLLGVVVLAMKNEGSGLCLSNRPSAGSLTTLYLILLNLRAAKRHSCARAKNMGLRRFSHGG